MSVNIAGWRIDEQSRVASKNGQEQRLSPRAIKLLAALAEAAGAVRSRAQLQDVIWPDVIVSDESLSQVVAEVRRVLGDPGLIETIPRGGYRLTVPVLQALEPQASPASGPQGAFSLDAYALCIEADLRLARGDEGAYAQGVALAAQAASLAPDFALARATHAAALIKQHFFWSDGKLLLETALEEAQKAIELQPGLAKAHMSEAVIKMAVGVREEGVTALETALASEPQNAELHLDSAELLLAAGKSPIAAALALKASTLEPTRFEGLFLAARALYRIDPARSRTYAMAALQKAQAELALDPSALSARYALGPLLAMVGDSRTAVAALESLEQRKTPLEYYRSLGFGLVGDCTNAVDTISFIASNGWRYSCGLTADDSLASLDDQPRFRRLRRDLIAA
ncbi:MAG: hypothetical protein Kilf2KO_49010 [Rhodospirillales bacterium]